MVGLTIDTREALAFSVAGTIVKGCWIIFRRKSIYGNFIVELTSASTYSRSVKRGALASALSIDKTNKKKSSERLAQLSQLWGKSFLFLSFTLAIIKNIIEGLVEQWLPMRFRG